MSCIDHDNYTLTRRAEQTRASYDERFRSIPADSVPQEEESAGRPASGRYADTYASIPVSEVDSPLGRDPKVWRSTRERKDVGRTSFALCDQSSYLRLSSRKRGKDYRRRSLRISYIPTPKQATKDREGRYDGIGAIQQTASARKKVRRDQELCRPMMQKGRAQAL